MTISKRKDMVGVDKTMNNCRMFYKDKFHTAQRVGAGIYGK